MQITATESTPFIAEGMYLGTVSNVEVEPSKNPEWADQLKFTFVLDGQFFKEGDKAGQPIDIWHYCPQKLTPKSKLWATLVAFGIQPVLNQNFDTDDWFGKRANLIVKHVDTASGPKAKIVDMLKVGGVAAPPAVAPAEEPPDVCVVCARKGKSIAVAKYGGGGEPLCAAHDEEDLS